MKTQLKIAALALALSTLNSQLSTAFSQGSLTPPGGPAPTMKTLAQIEPRTPISTAPFTIINSGSYYLTTNLNVTNSSAIIIASNGVTLDLNGFTISSSAGSATGSGIWLNPGWKDITIYNGHIQGGVTNNGSGVYSGSGFGYGIASSGNQPANVLVSRVSVSGCLYDGISLLNGDATVVESCSVRTVGGNGIVASTVKSSVAIDCGNDAIHCDQVSDSRGFAYGSGSGIYATSVAQNCYGFCSGSGSFGIYVGYTAQNCYGGTDTGTYGLYSGTAQNCYGYSTSSGTGLYANQLATGCYGYSFSGTGLYASAVATGCYGISASSGTGLHAFIASLCHGVSSSGTALDFTHNVNSY